jgi:hypothetical protein
MSFGRGWRRSQPFRRHRVLGESINCYFNLAAKPQFFMISTNAGVAINAPTLGNSEVNPLDGVRGTALRFCSPRSALPANTGSDDTLRERKVKRMVKKRT